MIISHVIHTLALATHPWTHQVSSGRSCVPLSQPDCTELPGERPTVGRHGRLAETTAIGDNSEAACASHTTTNDRRPRLRRCCTARLERPACWHRFCTVTGHFQAALEDSSVWTVIRLTTDLVTCPWSFAYGRFLRYHTIIIIIIIIFFLNPRYQGSRGILEKKLIKKEKIVEVILLLLFFALGSKKIIIIIIIR